MPKIMTVGNLGGGHTQSRTVYLIDGLSPTLCSSMGETGNTIPYIVEVKKMNVKEIGRMDHTLDNTFESANRVYDTDGLSPTINTCGGGGLQPKIVDVEKIIVDDMYNNRDARAYDEYAPAIRSERNGLKVIEATPTIKVRQATQQGFIECEVGGVVDLSYPTSQKRRGRVQGGGQIWLKNYQAYYQTLRLWNRLLCQDL